MPEKINAMPSRVGESVASDQPTGWENMDVRKESIELSNMDENPVVGFAEEVNMEAESDLSQNSGETDETAYDVATDAGMTNFELGKLTYGDNVSEGSGVDKPDGEGEAEAEATVIELLKLEAPESKKIEPGDPQATAVLEASLTSAKLSAEEPALGQEENLEFDQDSINNEPVNIPETENTDKQGKEVDHSKAL